MLTVLRNADANNRTKHCLQSQYIGQRHRNEQFMKRQKWGLQEKYCGLGSQTTALNTGTVLVNFMVGC